MSIHNAIVENGKATITISTADLTAGNHNLKAKYLVNDNYKSSNARGILTLEENTEKSEFVAEINENRELDLFLLINRQDIAKRVSVVCDVEETVNATGYQIVSEDPNIADNTYANTIAESVYCPYTQLEYVERFYLQGIIYFMNDLEYTDVISVENPFYVEPTD